MNFIFNHIRRLRKYVRKIYYTRKAIKGILSFKELPTINSKSSFNKNTTIGRNCHFNGIDINGGGKVMIGDNFHSGHSCMMITQNHNIHGKALPYDDTYVLKNILIEDNVWLGNRVIILGGVCIGEGSVIQAGSVVVSDIPPLSIAGGHPATVFNKRDADHYFSLKKQQKFH